MTISTESMDGDITRVVLDGRLDIQGAAAIDLTKADLEEIEQAFAGLKAQGARYPEQMLKLVGR